MQWSKKLLETELVMTVTLSHTPMAKLHRIPVNGPVFIVFPFFRPSFRIECFPEIVEAVKLMKDL
jgi:hypothetical protein